jgi:hypothetical protein
MKFLITNNISTNNTLANKWFAFSKLEDDNFELLKRIDNILGDRKI